MACAKGRRVTQSCPVDVRLSQPGSRSKTVARSLSCVLLSVVTLTACSSTSAAPAGAPDGVPGSASAGPTGPPVAGVAATFPLTGEVAPSLMAASAPIVAVAVDGGEGLPEPSGVDRADVVYVHFPVAGRQRGLALYQSKDTDRVGPVGDTRPVDSSLLIALNAVIAHSGGPSSFVKQIDKTQLPDWSSVVHPNAFETDAAGLVYGSSTAARAAAGAVPARAGLLPFDAPGPPAPQSAPPPAVTVSVAGQAPFRLSYDVTSGTWRGGIGGFSLAAANVVVQQVGYTAVALPFHGSEGNPGITEGGGAATVLTGPRVDPTATWNRPGRETSTKYIGGDKVPIRLSPGQTWILLVPTGSAVTTT